MRNPRRFRIFIRPGMPLFRHFQSNKAGGHPPALFSFGLIFQLILYCFIVYNSIFNYKKAKLVPVRKNLCNYASLLDIKQAVGISV